MVSHRKRPALLAPSALLYALGGLLLCMTTWTAGDVAGEREQLAAVRTTLSLRVTRGNMGGVWAQAEALGPGRVFSALPALRALRGGRWRVRIGKNRWIDPRKIVRAPQEDTSPDPDPFSGLNITIVPEWTPEGQSILNYGGDDVDEHGRRVSETYLYQTPRRILNYTSFLEQETPRIANTRLWHAAELGEDDEIRLVAAFLSADVNSSNPLAYSFTAMHWAALRGHSSTVSLLASMGADVNACDAFDSRPLHYAADAGHVRYMRPCRCTQACPDFVMHIPTV